MSKNLCGKSLLTLLDLSSDDIRYLLELAVNFKNLKRTKTPHRYLEGKNIVLIFEKTSTRTRCSFEVAGMDLGLGVTYLESSGSQIGKKESIKDTARVLGRIYDGIEYRGYEQKTVEILAQYSGIPVWNGLTDRFHPTQMLADLMTIEEKFGHLKNLNLTFMGDARNNIGNSLMIACAKMGINFIACAPKKLWPEEDLIKQAYEIAKKSGCSINFTEDVKKAASGSDIIYTDIWVSMGEPQNIWEEKINLLKPYQVNADVMSKAKKDAVFMHCLPAFHDLNTAIASEIYRKFGLKEMEVSDEVFESSQSIVFDEAENRMHTIKAVIYSTLC